MTTITTVRAALQAIAAHGMSNRSLYQLGSAMGPANLYVAGVDTAGGFQPLRRTDSAGRASLLAFTTPRRLTGRADPPVTYRELTGAALLRLAGQTGGCLVLEANSPLECRITPGAAQSLQVAAGYTEALVSGTPSQGERLAS